MLKNIANAKSRTRAVHRLLVGPVALVGHVDAFLGSVGMQVRSFAWSKIRVLTA